MLSVRSSSLILVCLLATFAGAQTISNGPSPISGFIDISGTGTALTGAGDDTDHGFVSTIGNSMFPAGNILMTSNGYAVSGEVPQGYSVYYNEGAGPITASTDASSAFGLYQASSPVICPFWDDLYCFNAPNTSLYWQEFPGVLIMQFNNVEKYYPATPGANGYITFQIQVYAGAPCSPETIQILYPDATFGLGGAFYDNGAGATIGYIGGTSGNANAAWSYDTASVPDGTCLTISKTPGFGLAFSSPLGNGSLRADMCGGPASGSYFLAVTLNVGNFPAGWLYGIDIPYAELSTELTFGYPFMGSLTGSGTAVIGPFTNLPSGLTLFAVAFGAPAGSLPTSNSGPNFYVVP